MTEKKIALVNNEAIGKIAQEMGLNRWFIMSKHAEAKYTRTNLKKLGCLFEAFIGALFLDCNKLPMDDVYDTGSRSGPVSSSPLEPMFVTGPGFQIAQIFLESVFETHVNWIELICNDDNYKNILQIKIQKSFKVTPIYLEMDRYNSETGFHMGVYLYLGQGGHYQNMSHRDAVPMKNFQSIQDVHQYISNNSTSFIFLGEGRHKIKKKAEQLACGASLRVHLLTGEPRFPR